MVFCLLIKMYVVHQNVEVVVEMVVEIGLEVQIIVVKEQLRSQIFIVIIQKRLVL